MTNARIDDHNNNFDLIRLFAALQVVVIHSVGHLELPTADLFRLLAPFPGVAIFFIVSGFLVTDSFLRSRSLGQFAKNRALRIYPGLAVNILVLDAAMYLAGGLTIADWPRYVGYLAVYIPTASYEISSGLLSVTPYSGTDLLPRYPSGVMWTLTVEISFYIALAALLLLLRRARLSGLLLFAGMVAVSLWLSVDLKETPYQLLTILFPAFFWIFGIGIAARLAWARIAWLFESRFLWWFGLYVAFTAACIFHYGRYSPVWWLDFKEGGLLTTVRMVLLAAVVLSAAFSFRGASKVLRGIDLSYGIYLYHMLVITALMGLGYKGGGAWIWLAVFGGTAAIAAASWFLVERLALRLKGRRPGRPTLAPHPAATV